MSRLLSRQPHRLGIQGGPGLYHTVQGLSPALQDFIDQTVSQGLIRCEEIVTVCIFFDLLDRLSGVLCKEAIEALAKVKDELGVDRDVRRLALETAHRLMDEHCRVGQAEALAA